MSNYQARVRWQRRLDESFIDSQYSREHTWEFDGGVLVPASSAVSSVPMPYSKAENVDPEEAFVAAVSSCHLLTFLYLAGKANFVIDAYDDLAIGRLSKNEQGRLAMTSIMLAPDVVFSGPARPTEADTQRLHHAAHEECYIANSILTHVTIKGKWRHVAA